MRSAESRNVQQNNEKKTVINLAPRIRGCVIVAAKQQHRSAIKKRNLKKKYEFESWVIKHKECIRASDPSASHQQKLHCKNVVFLNETKKQSLRASQVTSLYRGLHFAAKLIEGKTKTLKFYSMKAPNKLTVQSQCICCQLLFRLFIHVRYWSICEHVSNCIISHFVRFDVDVVM